MAKMKGARAFLECLKLEGVKYIFGNPGTTEVPLLDALCDFPEITYVLTLQESVAVGMADGYTRAGGDVAVVNVHTSVGTANTIGGVYTASIAKSPVVVAIANKDMRILGRNSFCEVPDLPGMTRQFTKWSWEVRRAERIPEDVLHGIKVATTFPRGPVFLSFAEDMLDAEIEVEGFVSTRPQSRLSFQGNEEEIRKAAHLLLSAETPLFISGNEVAGSGAFYEAVELAELLSMPVMTEGRESWASLNFPHTHPLFRGGYDSKSSYAKKADVVLGIGCKMFVDSNFSPIPDIPPQAKIIHFHSDPSEIGRRYPEEVSVLCETRSGMKALLHILRPLVTGDLKSRFQKRMERLRGEKEAEREEREKIVREHWDDVPIHLTRLVRELNQALDKDAIIVDEAARSSRTLLKFYDFEVPGTFHRSVGGYLGWGGPAALGVKLANPGRQVISLVGDGSFLFSIQNLWTAAKYHIPVVVVICNNREYRAVKETCVQYKGAGAEKRVFPATEIKDPDIEFCRLAEGFGVWARKIVHPEEIGPALKEALSLGKAAVLDVRIA